MNSAALANSAYGEAQSAVNTPRQSEYRAFALVTHRLTNAATSEGPDAFARLASAVHDNRRLWTALAADATQSANQLPSDLRAQIVYLAEFTIAHSQRVLKGEAELGPLIEINTAVMKGLRGKGEDV